MSTDDAARRRPAAGALSPAPTVGDRVVIRYRLGADAPADWRDSANPPVAEGRPGQSDITGILRDRDAEAVTVERDGVAHRVPAAAISSIRLLSRRVVRNSEIREIERTLMLAASTAERGSIDGWLANGAGPDLRSGAVAPIDFGSTAAGLRPALDWLEARGLPGRVVLADRLLRPAGLGAATATAYEVLVGPQPRPDSEPADLGPWSLLSDGVAAATVAATDDAARAAWRARGFELHHTCRLLTF